MSKSHRADDGDEDLGRSREDEGSHREDHDDGHDGRREGRRSAASCVAVLVAVGLLIGGGYFAVTKGVDGIKGLFAGAEDYPGPGKGKVLVEVREGDSGGQIGNTLKAMGVVKSVDAFTDALASNEGSQSIQVGFYELKKEMKASDAVDVLVEPDNVIRNTVAVPEGLRVVDIVEILADKTDFSKKQFDKVLDSPAELGLPSYARGNAEGYLFPATYAFSPNATPTTMLKAMVDRWKQAAKDADLEGLSKKLGYSPNELMIVASLVEAEARGDDMAKVARVIYNRLEGDETNGLLQIDATVNYGLGQDLGVGLTTEQLQQDTPYNTYTRTGLPPTPIEAPGDDAIEAATHPADGDWYYYVTVNLKTGETKFTSDYDEFTEYKAEFKHYCETSDAC
jgi:peptidoglycan lytic transglycosylase G